MEKVFGELVWDIWAPWAAELSIPVGTEDVHREMYTRRRGAESEASA